MVHSHHHHPLLQDILRPLLVTIGNHHLLLLVLFPLHKQFLKNPSALVTTANTSALNNLSCLGSPLHASASLPSITAT